MIFIQDINCLISFILWTPKSLEVHTCRIGPKPTMGIGIISMARPQAEAIGRTEAATARAANDVDAMWCCRAVRRYAPPCNFTHWARIIKNIQ